MNISAQERVRSRNRTRGQNSNEEVSGINQSSRHGATNGDRTFGGAAPEASGSRGARLEKT